MPPVLTVRRCGATTRRQTTRASTGSGVGIADREVEVHRLAGAGAGRGLHEQTAARDVQHHAGMRAPRDLKTARDALPEAGVHGGVHARVFGRTRGGLERQPPRSPGRAERSAMARAASQSGTLTRSTFSKPSPAVSPARQRA